MVELQLHFPVSLHALYLFPVSPTSEHMASLFYFSSLILRLSVGVLGRRISTSQGRYLHRTTQTQNKRTQISELWVGFEPTIPVFEQARRPLCSATISCWLIKHRETWFLSVSSNNAQATRHKFRQNSEQLATKQVYSCRKLTGNYITSKSARFYVKSKLPIRFPM
jgi:hypothetical protein